LVLNDALSKATLAKILSAYPGHGLIGFHMQRLLLAARIGTEGTRKRRGYVGSMLAFQLEGRLEPA
jgi:hypothetical protein